MAGLLTDRAMVSGRTPLASPARRGARRHASQTWRQARQAPLMRFCPLQHIPAASHCPEAASLSGTVPLRRLTRRPMCRRGSSMRFSMPVGTSAECPYRCDPRTSRGARSRVMHRRFLASDVPLPARVSPGLVAAWLLPVQQRSWGCALRSVDPDTPVTRTFPWAGPTCRFLPAVHLDIFRRGTSRAEVGCITHIPADSSWTLSSRLLGFIPAANLPLRDPFSPDAPRQCCHGLCLFQDLRDAARRVHAGSTPRGPSTSGNRFRLRSAHGFHVQRQTRNDGEAIAGDFLVRHAVRGCAPRRTIPLATIRY